MKATVVMRDLACLTAEGTIRGINPEQVEELTSDLRFKVDLSYATPYLIAGEDQTETLSMKNWEIILKSND